MERGMKKHFLFILAIATNLVAMDNGKPSEKNSSMTATVKKNTVVIESPSDGIIYLAKTLDRGDMVTAWQTVFNIKENGETHALMPSIKGRVYRVLVRNESPVKKGDPIMVIEIGY